MACRTLIPSHTVPIAADHFYRPLRSYRHCSVCVRLRYYKELYLSSLEYFATGSRDFQFPPACLARRTPLSVFGYRFLIAKRRVFGSMDRFPFCSARDWWDKVVAGVRKMAVVVAGDRKMAVEVVGVRRVVVEVVGAHRVAVEVAEEYRVAVAVVGEYRVVVAVAKVHMEAMLGRSVVAVVKMVVEMVG